MSPEEWDATRWDIQMAYLAGLAEDEEVPFAFREGDPMESGSPRIRENVDAGTSVIDIKGMIADLELMREKG
jgi:hypothetical protein